MILPYFFRCIGCLGVVLLTLGQTGCESTTSKKPGDSQTKKSTPTTEPGVSKSTVKVNFNDVAVPEGLDTTNQIYLAQIINRLQARGLNPVIGDQGAIAPYRLKFEVKSNFLQGKEAYIILEKGGIPVMSAKASRTSEETKAAGSRVSEELFMESLVRFEMRMNETQFKP
jgi:hypothetical protein